MNRVPRKEYIKQVCLSYGMDIVLSGILFIPAILGPWTKPYERPIDLSDQRISFPYDNFEMFPPWTLPFICFGIPATCIVVCLAMERFKRRRLLIALVGLLFCLSLTDFCTNVLKIFTGRLRPDFLARCIPKVDSSGNVFCTQKRLSFLWEGRKSFPSGHASTSFAGLGFLALFLSGHMEVYAGRGNAWRLFLAFLPLLFASIVAISRYNDYRHHWEDVLFGSLLGLITSWFVYLLYFPSPFSLTPSIPHSDRFDEIEEKVVNANNIPAEINV